MANNIEIEDEDSIILSADDGDEEALVYNEQGEEVNLEKNSRKIVSKVDLIKRRGKRGKIMLYFDVYTMNRLSIPMCFLICFDSIGNIVFYLWNGCSNYQGIFYRKKCFFRL